jgi:hypothetical protein
MSVRPIRWRSGFKRERGRSDGGKLGDHLIIERQHRHAPLGIEAAELLALKRALPDRRLDGLEIERELVEQDMRGE